MTDKQNQKVGDEAQAIQAGGNVTINNGLSASQLVEIIDAVSRQIQTFTEDAHKTINQRLEDFKKDVLEGLTHDPKARSQAFSDPDFQHALFDAQKAYARTDDTNLHSVLVDLVIQRSKQEKRDRLTLTLNGAIEKAPALTDEDFNILAMNFVMQRVQFTGPVNLDTIASVLRDFVDPLIDSIPKSDSAYSYLESQGCLTQVMGGFQQAGAFEILNATYPSVLTKGISKEDIETLSPSGKPKLPDGIFRASPFDKDRLVLMFVPPSNAPSILTAAGVTEDIAERYTTLAKAAPVSREDFISVVREKYARVQHAFDVYDNSPIRNTRLTSIGLTLAHAYLTKKIDLRADLSIWIS